MSPQTFCGCPVRLCVRAGVAIKLFAKLINIVDKNKINVGFFVQSAPFLYFCG